MSKEERYAEHTVAWELPKCDTVTKGNYNLADIEMKYMPIQTEVVSDSKDKIIADLQSQLAEKEKENDTFTAKLEQANEIINNPDTLIFQQQELIDNLQSQLAEKEKEQNQKAIEQLEKVKEFFLKEHRDEEMDTDYLITKDAGEIADFLLNQIKQLKEMK